VEAALLKELKNEVLVEKDAGTNAFITNEAYQEAGAKLVERKEIFKSDLLIGVNPPAMEEVDEISADTALIGLLNPFGNDVLIKKLITKKITSFSLELVPRITRAQSMDVLSSMGTIAGYKAVLYAATLLPKFFPMFMSAAGTIKPAKVLILGAGVAGLQAIAISRKLGGVVEVFDVRSAVKEEVQSLGGKFIEVEGATEDKSAGGYAVEQTEEYKQKQSQLIHDHVAKADVVICTAQIPGKKAPVLVKKESVELMKPGSVIIDLAASTGGNCEVTQQDKTHEHSGVKIVGESSFPEQMPADASSMLSKNITNFIKLLIDENGALKLNFDDEVINGTCLSHHGEIINERIKSMKQQ
jgi:NAD(P) transhydrogenase subunit alpha